MHIIMHICVALLTSPAHDGSRARAQDKGGLWGQGAVVATELSAVAPADASTSDSAADTSTADDSAADASAAQSGRVRVSWRGFSKKYDEWLEVGGGRLRPLEEGPPGRDGFDDEVRGHSNRLC